MALRHHRPLTVDVVRLCTGSSASAVSTSVDLGSFVGMVVDVRCDAELLAFARNRVLPESLGDWVVFVDDSVDVCRRWADRLERDLGAVHVFDLVACSVACPRLVRVGHQMSGPGVDVAYRRAALDRAGAFETPTTEGWTIDLEMQLRLTSMGHVIQRGDRTSR